MQRRWTILVFGACALAPTVLIGADLAPRLIGSEHSPAALSPPEPPPENAVVPLPGRPATTRRSTQPSKIQQVGWQAAWTRVQTAVAPAGKPRP